jgi:hypothetical protein
MRAIRHRDRRRGAWVISGWTLKVETPTHELTPTDNWPSEWRIEARLDSHFYPGDKQVPPKLSVFGGHVFVRGKLRKRYLVFAIGAQRDLRSTGMEIRFNRKTRRWQVFERRLSVPSPDFDTSTIEGFGPRNEGCETLVQAKASVSTSLLERLAAEA